MRRQDREVADIKELLQIIDECKVFRIAMQDENGLYIVPLNFGYEYVDGKLSLYVHSAKEGRKVDILSKEPTVAFEMDCAHHLIEAEEASRYSYAFKSIIGNGKAIRIHDTEEKIKALKLLMLHQSGKNFNIPSHITETVAIFKIVATNFTGKRKTPL